MPAKLPLLFVAALCAGCSTPSPKTITAPPAERIAALLDFAGPVSLTCHVATAEELARWSKSQGIKGEVVASFSYTDPHHSSDSIIINILKAGSFLGDRRAKLISTLTNLPKEIQKDGWLGVFKAADGRPIYQFMMGIGTGGGMAGALLSCRDPRYEILLEDETDGHDGQDQKLFASFVSPRKQLREVIESIESLGFQ